MNGRKLAGSAIFCTLLVPSCFVVEGEWGEEVSYQNFRRSEPLTGEAHLEADVELKVGRVQVGPAAPDEAFALNLDYNELAFTPQLDFSRSDETARLHFEMKGEGRSLGRHGNTRLDLKLNPTIPLDLQAATGVGETVIDLGGMKVRSLILESGVGETRLSMLEPNRTECESIEIASGVGSLDIVGLGNFGFRQFDFEGGVGGSTLDFSGEWKEIGEIEIEVGVGGVEVQLPRGIGAEVRVSKSFLSAVDLSGFTKRGSVYYSDNLDRVDKVLKLRIRAGIGGVEVRWI